LPEGFEWEELKKEEMDEVNEVLMEHPEYNRETLEWFAGERRKKRKEMKT
jgi:hypothetical protein